MAINVSDDIDLNIERRSLTRTAYSSGTIKQDRYKKAIIAYIRSLYKVVEYMMYSKDIYSLECFAHSSVRHVGVVRGVSYRSGTFVLSE